MAEIVALEIPARPDFLALARLIVAATAAADPLLPEDRIEDLRLAVSEACTNAIEAHQRVGSEPSNIRIECRLGPEQVEVEVQDRGAGFDPDDLVDHPPASDPTRLNHERGLGIPLIRVLTDEVEFRPTVDGTAVRMVLRVAAPRPAR